MVNLVKIYGFSYYLVQFIFGEIVLIVNYTRFHQTAIHPSSSFQDLIYIYAMPGYVQKITARRDIDLMEDLDNGKPS